MFQSSNCRKVGTLLNHEGCESIKIPIVGCNRSPVENQEKFLKEQNAFNSGSFLTASTNAVGSDGFQGGSAEGGPTAVSIPF